MEFTKQQLKKALSGHRKVSLTAGERAASAVVVPLYDKQGKSYLLLTKRTQTVKNHKGQICFPGGVKHPGDMNLLDTALRECREEIGVRPADVEVLGELDDVLTHTSGYVISPFVSVVPCPYHLTVNRDEIDQVIEVPLLSLLDKTRLRQEQETLRGETFPVYFYHYQDQIIWGATAQILTQFLDIITRVLV